MRAAYGLHRCHLLGQSWGGWLAIEYMARGPAGIERLVLASTSASIPQFMAEARRLIEAMPEPHRTVLIELGAKGDYDHPDYVGRRRRVLPPPSLPGSTRGRRRSCARASRWTETRST